MDALLELAACYRAAQLYAHTAHHLVKGPTFFQDHEEFGELYPAYETAFDDLAEEALALGMSYDPAVIMQRVVRKLNPTYKDHGAKEFYTRLLAFERDFQAEIKALMAGSLTDGTQNLIQGLATESSKRVYKFNARLA
jgi:DNA-binding ferritin-like protein